MSVSRWSLACTATAALLAAGCTILPDAPAVTRVVTLSVAVDSSTGPLFRTLRIGLDGPAPVQVDYWTAGGPRLRVTVADADSAATVFLPRLRPSTSYTYQVRAVLSDGTLGDPFTGTLTTDSLPSALAAYGFDVQGTPTFGVAMLELWGAYTGWVAVDGAGQVVWFRPGCAPQGFTVRANGDFVFLDECAGMTEVKPDGEEVAALPSGWGMNHDVIPTPQNTLLFIGEDVRAVNDTNWTGPAIYEWDPASQAVTLRWSAFDFFSPATDRGPATQPADWLHPNSLAIGPRGNVVLSLLYTGQVISIAPGYGSLEWRLGGPNATITPDSDAVTFGQHTAAEIAPNHVLVFDNETYGAGPDGKHSRGLEVAIDPETGTAHKVWEFRATPDIWAPYVGSARALANGDRVVSFGMPAQPGGVTGPVAAYEVAPGGEVVWRLAVNGAALNYRTTPLASLAGEVETSDSSGVSSPHASDGDPTAGGPARDSRGATAPPAERRAPGSD